MTESAVEYAKQVFQNMEKEGETRLKENFDTIQMEYEGNVYRVGKIIAGSYNIGFYNANDQREKLFDIDRVEAGLDPL